MSNTVRWASLVLSGALLCSSGCGSKSKAAGAQSPPPPSLSAPVRAQQDDKKVAPTATVVPGEEYAFLKDRQPGSTTPLPTVAAPSAPPPPAAELQGKPNVYVMQKGDTLYGIARKFNVPPKNLIACNEFKDPNHLPVGTKVRIP